LLASSTITARKEKKLGARNLAETEEEVGRGRKHKGIA
jgi:hypothetical protein